MQGCAEHHLKSCAAALFKPLYGPRDITSRSVKVYLKTMYSPGNPCVGGEGA